MRSLGLIFIGVILMLLWSEISISILKYVYLNGYYSIFISCVWAPIWEEIRFRWAPILMAKMIDDKLVWPVAIFFATQFGMSHGDPQTGTFIQGIHGLILAYIYIKTKKIRYAMIAHCAYNSILYMIAPY